MKPETKLQKIQKICDKIFNNNVLVIVTEEEPVEENEYFILTFIKVDSRFTTRVTINADDNVTKDSINDLFKTIVLPQINQYEQKNKK